jgi:hypothetical protein
MVATPACNPTTCDSMAIVARSRNRKCTRSPTIRMIQPKLPDVAKPIEAVTIKLDRP